MAVIANSTTTTRSAKVDTLLLVNIIDAEFAAIIISAFCCANDKPYISSIGLYQPLNLVGKKGV